MLKFTNLKNLFITNLLNYSHSYLNLFLFPLKNLSIYTKMGDQDALQEAIQRARQLAAKISQNAPVKQRLDDHRDISKVKVSLAYEKPANSNPSEHRENREQREHREHHPSNSSSSSSVNNNISNNNNNNNNNHPSSISSSTNSNNVINNSQTHKTGHSMLSGANTYSSGSTSGMLSGANNYSSGSADERIEIIIPHAVIGLVIGKGGENIKRIQNETGATVRVDPNTVDEKGNKVCTITGTKQAVEEAHNQVSNVIENAATNKRPRMQTEGSEQYRMKIPASRTGAIIGKGGETIKSIKLQSGCDIELDKGSKDSGSEESIFIIRGTQDKILKARAMIESRLASRGRDGDNRDNSGRQPNLGPKGVATGANAAPVAPYTDLPAAYPGKLNFQHLIVGY